MAVLTRWKGETRAAARREAARRVSDQIERCDGTYWDVGWTPPVQADSREGGGGVGRDKKDAPVASAHRGRSVPDSGRSLTPSTGESAPGSAIVTRVRRILAMKGSRRSCRMRPKPPPAVGFQLRGSGGG